MRGDDGYDRIEAARDRGWSAVPSWGRDSSDLGAWPLVVISHRRTEDAFEIAYDVEGDITVHRYPTRELRDAATDCLALWLCKHQGEEWVGGVESVDVAPDRLRGPFSCRRQDASDLCPCSWTVPRECQGPTSATASETSASTIIVRQRSRDGGARRTRASSISCALGLLLRARFCSSSL